MRPIKFRAKRVDNGEWVYGYVLETRMSGVYIIGTKQTMKSSQYEVKIGDRLWQHEVDPETVGQYTGYKQGDTEIYEGDIFKFVPQAEFKDKVADPFYTPVEYIDGCFLVVDNMGDYYSIPDLLYKWDIDDEEYEVCGNIHDNPNLLLKGR